MEKQTNLLFNFKKPEIVEEKSQPDSPTAHKNYLNIEDNPIGFLAASLLVIGILGGLVAQYKNDSNNAYVPINPPVSTYISDVSQKHAILIGNQLGRATEQLVARKIEERSNNNNILLTQYAKEVKSITPKELKEINLFINEVKKMEQTRLNELTLKIRYVVNKNPYRYHNGNSALANISQLKIDTNDYYNEILLGINRTYKIAKNTNEKDYKDIDFQFADPAIDSLKEVIQWKNYKDLNIKPTLQNNDEIIVEWAPSIVDQDGIEDYLAKNKNFISQ